MKKWLSFFHFVLLKPNYGVLSDPPIIMSRHSSREPLVRVFRENETVGVLEYDTNQGLYRSMISRDNKKLLFSWNHSSVLDRFLDQSNYLKLDIRGSMVRLNIDSGRKEVNYIGLEDGDYLTCADFWRDKGLAVSFNNHFYLFDGKNAHMIMNLSLDMKQFLYATSIRSFWKRGGPVHVLVRYQKGGFIYLKFLDMDSLKDVKILEKTMFASDNAQDFNLDDRFIYVLDDKKRLTVSSLQDRDKLFVMPLRDSFSAVSVRDGEIHLFDPKSVRWSTIRPKVE